MMKAQRLRLLSIGSAAVVGIAALALAGAAFSSRTPPPLPDNRVNNDARLEPTPVTGAVPAQSNDIVVERVTVLPYGFEPEEITRPEGTFLLAVDNRAGTQDLSFELVSDSSQLVHSASIRRGQARTQKLLTLPPGRYVFREANHPKWTCPITITPK